MKNILIVAFMIFGLIIYICLLLKKQGMNVYYTNENICGVVVRLNSRYQGRGVRYYSVDFRSDRYGIVSYDTDTKFKDSRFNLDFSNLKKDQKVCFLVKKPINSESWNKYFLIVKILNVKINRSLS